MGAYAKIAGPAIEAEGGRFIARGVPAEILEGANNNRVVIIEFESADAAMAAYRSDGYQEAMKALGDGAQRDYRIVPRKEKKKKKKKKGFWGQKKKKKKKS